MNANYAKICKVGILEADFQQVLLVQFFGNFHNIVKQQLFKFSKEKTKIPKNCFTVENALFRLIFSRKFNFRVNI